LRIGGGPGRLRGLRVGDGVLDLGMLGERNLGLHLAGVGVEDVAEAPGNPFDLFAADEMADLTHGFALLELLMVVNPLFPGGGAVCADIYSISTAGHGPCRRGLTVFPSPKVRLYPSLTAPV